MSGPGTYWSIEECGWVACPGRPDALATPWSAHGIEPAVLDGAPAPHDADDLLRTRRAGQVPGQRSLPERAPLPH